MPEIISARKARTNLSPFGWMQVQMGMEWYSRRMTHVIYKAGYLYKWRRCLSKW